MNSLITITLFIISVGLLNCAEKKECTISEEQAEECGARMLVLGNNFTMPKTTEDIANKCVHIQSGIDCFKDYAKNCLDSFASRIMGMIGRNGKKMADKLCKEEASRTELLTHLNCWKTAENMIPINMCLDKYIVQMESLGDVDNDNRIGATCCSFHMLKDCMKVKGQKNCDNPESLEYMEGLATGVTGDLIKFVCGKFKSMEDCDTKLDATVWKKLKDLVASEDPEVIKAMKKFPTPFGALKDMIKKFKQ